MSIRINCVYGIRKKNSKDYIYVGSSTNFRQRIIQHKHSCNKINNKLYGYPLYKYIRENGDFDNFQFDILERVIFFHKQNIYEKRKYLEKVEQEYMDLYNPITNKHSSYIPGNTKQEKHRECDRRYREKNIEKERERSRRFKKENRQKVREQERRGRERNKKICFICNKSGGSYNKFYKSHLNTQTHKNNTEKFFSLLN